MSYVKSPLRNTSTNSTIILKYMFQKHGAKVGVKSIYLRMRFNGAFFENAVMNY
jgi:hypothetical protein